MGICFRSPQTNFDVRMRVWGVYFGHFYKKSPETYNFAIGKTKDGLASELLSRNAIAVKNSINNIAGIIENGAAATEQVAASTQEQTATIQQIEISAESLAKLAGSLQYSIDKFKV